jgi:rod shape-determining protein MreD
MSNISAAHIIHAIVILLLQLLVLKNFSFPILDKYVFTIFLYPLIIILAPLKTPKALVITLAFMMGLLMDLFYNSPGIHTSALVFVAFVRGIVLILMEPRRGYRIEDLPLATNYGLTWYAMYSGALLFFFVFFYFIVDIFTFYFFDKILVNTILCLIPSFLLTLFYQMFIKS